MADRHTSAILADTVQAQINIDRGASFNTRLHSQTEQCARKVLERLQVGLATGQLTNSQEILNLTRSADILLNIRDRY